MKDFRKPVVPVDEKDTFTELSSVRYFSIAFK
jgi:hypothetical protein